MSVIGIDTSNYTTSIAFFDGEGGENCSRLLPVRQGELGLRQSDAVFAHIKSLPELSGRLFSHIQKDAITAVGVSTRPPGGGGELYALLHGWLLPRKAAVGRSGRAAGGGFPPAGTRGCVVMERGTDGLDGRNPPGVGICPAAPRSCFW